MKRIKVKRAFAIQDGPRKVKVIQPGTYRVPEDIDSVTAAKILKFGSAEIIIEKKAPENKLGTVAENKADLGGAADDSGGTGAKPDTGRSKRRKRAKARVEGSGGTG
jgi:hypothetical protein